MLRWWGRERGRERREERKDRGKKAGVTREDEEMLRCGVEKEEGKEERGGRIEVKRRGLQGRMKKGKDGGVEKEEGKEEERKDRGKKAGVTREDEERKRWWGRERGRERSSELQNTRKR